MATGHRRGVTAVVTEIKTRIAALMFAAGVLPWSGTAVFERVELFDSERLEDAFRYLTIAEKRVCVVVPLVEEFETVINAQQRKILVQRRLPVIVLCSDRLMGDRKGALYGTTGAAATPGAYALADLVLPAVTGQLLANPGAVVSVPKTLSPITVKDTEKTLAGRVTVGLELDCTGGWLEARLDSAGAIL